MIPSQLHSLANHLWQSTLFAVVAGLVTLALRRNRAQTRYWVWLAASVKFLVPFSLLMDLGGHFGGPTTTAISAPRISVVIEQASQPFTVPTPVATTTPPPAISLVNWILAFVYSVWALGVATLLISRWLGWRDLRAALRTASPVDLSIGIEAKASTALAEPGIFGVLRPVLLLPTGLTDTLTSPQLEAIVTHELCHVRRRDNVTAAIHMGVETLFWFYPLVWWLGARLMEERERACDEEVLLMGHEPEAYALAILEVCELYIESPLRCAAGMTGGNLKKRIEEIMANHEKPGLTASKKLLLAAGGLLALTIPVMIGMSNVQLKAQTAAEQGKGVLSWQTAAAGNMAFAEASVRRSRLPFSLPSFPLDSGDAYSKGGRFSADFPLGAYIGFAYKLSLNKAQDEAMFAHWPKWVTTERFEIEAKAAGNPTKDQMRLMMQSLLANRFGLAVHYETHVVPVFALTLNQSGKLGLNIRPYDAAHPCDSAGWSPFPAAGNTDGFPSCGSFGMFDRQTSGQSVTRWGARNVTMATLAANLSYYLSRPVIDRTELNGRFDVNMEWPLETVVVAPFRAEPDLPGPLLLHALREQLGLNLESTSAPVLTLVIENIESPVEN